MPWNKVEFTPTQIKQIKELRNKGYTWAEVADTLKIKDAVSDGPYLKLGLPTLAELKEKKIRELVKTKKYTSKQILDEIEKQFGGKHRSKIITKIAKQEKIKLPSGWGARGAIDSVKNSVYLKDYTFDNLEKDIKAGKTREVITNNLLDKNKEYYKTLKKSPEGLKYSISGAIGSRLKKRPALAIIEKNFIKQDLIKKRTALKDIQNFINKNKEAYKKVYASNKIGAVDNFKEKILDYISQKYPNFIKRAPGDSAGKILNNQRIFTPYEILGRDVTSKGDYGRDLALRKNIKKALGIPERPLKGEGEIRDRLTRRYNKDIITNLKTAQAKGLVPKIDPITGNPINSESAYYRYVNRTQIDPIRNLFGKKYKFGQEHVGGIARATIVNDAKVLSQITAMDPIQNKFVKGTHYDKRITTLMRLAKQSSPEKAKDYLAQAKKLIKEADIKFGLESPTPKLVGEEIINIHPKSSLEDSILKKAQRAIKSFIATGRDKEPAFKQIDPFLQNAIKMVKKVGTFNPASNQLLTKALRRTGVAGLVAVLGIGMLGGGAEAGEVTQPQKIEKPETVQYNKETGSFVNPVTEDKTDQNQLLEWIKENPVKTVAGTSIGFSTQEIPGAYKKARELGRGRVRSSLGITGALKPVLTTFGTPAMTALFEAPFAAKRLEEGESMTEVLTDPFGPALGLTFMEPLSKGAGVIRDAPKRTWGQAAKNYFDLSNVGKARPGVTSKVLRMGMSPRMIAGASRFLGLPGLALSLGLTGYDAYKNYQNEEGMLYNLFNKDE